MSEPSSIQGIGCIWQEGENIVLGGDVHEGLVRFQTAKKLLIEESKKLYDTKEADPSGDSGQRVGKILGSIMEKLTASIERNVALLHAKPTVALGLPLRNFTSADVKKAYRKMALRFHPDKNRECDTSCIFTAVQTAYEKLLATLDDSNGTSSATTAASNGASRARSGGAGAKENSYGQPTSASAASTAEKSAARGRRANAEAERAKERMAAQEKLARCVQLWARVSAVFFFLSSLLFVFSMHRLTPSSLLFPSLLQHTHTHINRPPPLLQVPQQGGGRRSSPRQ